MRIKSHYFILIILLLSFQSGLQQLSAQGLPINPVDEDPQRNDLIEPFRMVDNIYYIGATVHHSAYLLVSDEGHILVDATYERFVPNIIQNIETLGFDPRDIKVIVSNHAHPDPDLLHNLD
ncbi:MAG: MBL fold metallo-hydrolase, partial [Gammaproteobacteria bacterium]|nr:MBL fold metallo-hydrolase [Gammaproteobacteria bacterium]